MNNSSAEHLPRDGTIEAEGLARLAQLSGKRGWVAVHRSLRDHPRYSDSEFVHLVVHLYLLATHTECLALFRGKLITLRPGQLITGRRSLARDTGLSESKVTRVLDWLEEEQEIEQQGCNKNRLITLRSWGQTQQIGPQSSRSRTTAGPQPNTNNNLNTGNTVKNGTTYKASGPPQVPHHGDPRPTKSKKLSGVNKEIADRFEAALNGEWVNDAGKWVSRIKAERDKSERVISEVENAIKEGRIRATPAAFAEDIWKRFA